MKFRRGLIVVCTCAAMAVSVVAQSMSHEEEFVRNTYTTVSFLSGLPPLINVGIVQVNNTRITPALLAEQVSKATPVFELSDFTVGPISDIADRTWGEFNTAPEPGTSVLEAHITTQDYNDNGNNSEWKMVTAGWEPYHHENPEAVKLMLSQPIWEIVKLAKAQISTPITYTRYAAFTVNVTFQGRSTGPHKAIFFFGTDSTGKQFVSGNDLESGTTALYYFANHPAELSGLMLGKLREMPVVAEWLRNNVVPASSCSSDAQSVCCDHGRCGISPIEFNKDLSVPLPAPKRTAANQ